MKIYECEFGKIEYRIPNIPEMIRMLGMMGLTSKDLNNSKLMDENELIYTAKLIENIEPFLEKIDLKVNDKSVTTFEGMICEFDFLSALTEIAFEIMGAMGQAKKKEK